MTPQISGPCYDSIWLRHPGESLGICFAKSHISPIMALGFAGYVPLASQSPYPIIVYSVANYRPHLSHF